MTDKQREAQRILRTHGPLLSRNLAVDLGISTDAAGKLLNRLAERGIVQRLADGRWRA